MHETDTASDIGKSLPTANKEQTESSTVQRTAFLGSEQIFPLLLKMGIPATVGMLVNALYNIVDSIFVGQWVSPLAIGALTIVFPIQMIASALAQAIGVGSASIVSRKLGEKQAEDAAKIVGSSYTVVLLVNLVLVGIAYLFMDDLLKLFGARGEILPLAREYLAAVVPGLFFFGSSMVANNLIRAEGNPKASMNGMLIGAGTNIVLDPIFILVFGMGVRGAAIATVISQVVSTAYLFSLYPRKKSHIQLQRKDFRPNLRLAGDSFFLGLPAFIQSAGMSVLALILNNSLAFYGGDDAVSVYGMVNRLITLVIFPILGIAQGFQPIIGFNYGAKNWDRVKRTIGVTLATVFTLGCVAFALLMLFPSLFIRLFTPEVSYIQKGARVLRILIFFIPLGALQIIGATYFQAIGKRTQSLLLGLSRQFLVLIPLLLVLPRLLGLDGLWFAYPLADLVSVVITAALFLREVAQLGVKKA